MQKIYCTIEERLVNPLFEIFDGGDLILSSWRDIEAPLTEMRIFVTSETDARRARERLAAALTVLDQHPNIETAEVPDEDWKFAYRRHFHPVSFGRRLIVVPEWEAETLDPKLAAGRERVVLDPGMAFGTGKHETTRACLEYIDELAPAPGVRRTLLDMGCGSGILSIAAAKLGYAEVAGFDVDDEAVRASRENAAKNQVRVNYTRFALGRDGGADATFGLAPQPADVVAANILGPLLIRFADEIVRYAPQHLILSGILTELYPEVFAAYVQRGFTELDRRTLGEWTTGLLVWKSPNPLN